MEQGVDLVVIKELLGHAHIGATAGVYAHVYADTTSDSASNAKLSPPLTMCLSSRMAASMARPPSSSADVAVKVLLASLQNVPEGSSERFSTLPDPGVIAAIPRFA
ncbi:hypothetical protein OHA11_16740 [Streptomyces sp. NBC_00878]|nr:hypothetical protein [Streptomyces sp. NBC_00878]